MIWNSKFIKEQSNTGYQQEPLDLRITGKKQNFEYIVNSNFQEKNMYIEASANTLWDNEEERLRYKYICFRNLWPHIQYNSEGYKMAGNPPSYSQDELDNVANRTDNYPIVAEVDKEVSTHTGERSQVGEVCKQSFVQQDQLNEGVRIQACKQIRQCKYCPKRFYKFHHLTEHERTHTGEKPYQCKVCLQRFCQSSTLTKHLRKHTGEKPYECKVCLQRFSRSFSLKVHERTHTGEKRYQCKVCLQRFSHSSTLTKHIRTHTGEKPYQCKVCLQRFCQSSTLSTHKKTHTVYNPWEC